ncbi:MAG: hypothetical protein LLG16_09400 [Euryarchaeota archaeon]|nr:hypothetical protein [Euryarchaeota archaeon]
MAEVKAEKHQMSLAMDTDILASDVDAVMERGSPLYHSLIKAISEQSRPFLNPGSRVVDLFSNGGQWIEQLEREASFRCRFLSFNSTEEQKERCKDVMRMGIHLGNVSEFKIELGTEFPNVPSDLTLSIMGLSSFDAERRGQLMKEMSSHLQKRGAAIIVDRSVDVIGENIDWVRAMKDAGFRESMMFWKTGDVCAWIANK